jgi:methyl-accepting chemotaxis protein
MKAFAKNSERLIDYLYYGVCEKFDKGVNMEHNENSLDTMQKKLKDLDSEIDNFIQVISEVKETKGSVGDLQERLINHEGEIENKKKELDNLMSLTNNLVINIEEQMKGFMFDLEKKADALNMDMKKTLHDFKKQPHEVNNKLKRMEERVELLNEKYSRQKKFTLVLLLILIATVFFSVFAFYLR